MTFLNDVPVVQQLVGVCPELVMIVTECGGPVLYNWLRNGSHLLPYEWIDIATKIVEIFKAIHSRKIVHNYIKKKHLCEIHPQWL